MRGRYRRYPKSTSGCASSQTRTTSGPLRTGAHAGTTGAEVHLPFGGTKATGNGHREAGQAALDFYTEWKAIYVDYSGKLQRAQIDNAEERS